MYNKPDNKQLNLDLNLSVLDVMEKEALSPTWGAVAAPLLGSAGDFVGNVMVAGGHALEAIAGLAEESLATVTAAGVGTGLAAAYVAYKMKKPKASDIDVDRSNLYKETLKSKIMEIRRKQSIDGKQRKELGSATPERTLRLS